MFIDAFKNNRVYLPVVMVIVTFILWLDGFWFYADISVPSASVNHAPLYDFFVPFFGNYPFLNVLTGFIFLLIQSFLLNNVVTSKNLVERHSYMPGFIYALLMSSSFDMLSVHPVLFANFFLVIAINKIIDVHSEERIYLEVFNTGFLIGIATLFYYPAILFIIIAFISLFIYFITNLRRVIAIILGFVGPFFFTGLYFFMTDQLEARVTDFLDLHKIYLVFDIELERFFWVYLIVFAFITLIATVKVFFNVINDKPIRVRKRFQIVILLLVISLVALLFIPGTDLVHHALFNIPAAIILAAFFHSNKKRKWNEFFFSLLLIALILSKLERFMF